MFEGSDRLSEDEILSKNHPHSLKKPALGYDGKIKLFSQMADTRNLHEGNLHYSKLMCIRSLKGKGINKKHPIYIPISYNLKQKTSRDEYVPPLITFTVTVSTRTSCQTIRH